MKGLFVDNNIGEMFNDIFKDSVNDKLGSIFGGETEFGLGELTINIPTGDRFWYNFLPIMVIVAVIILGLIICGVRKKNRKKNQKVEIASDVEKIFAEAEEEFALRQKAGGEPSNAKKIGPETNFELFAPEFAEQTQAEPKIQSEAFKQAEPKIQSEAFKQAEYEPGEAEPIKVDKIEVVATKTALKFGKDNNNTTRSGRVFTEEELNTLIRK